MLSGSGCLSFYVCVFRVRLLVFEFLYGMCGVHGLSKKVDITYDIASYHVRSGGILVGVCDKIHTTWCVDNRDLLVNESSRAGCWEVGIGPMTCLCPNVQFVWLDQDCMAPCGK